jgi:four helix bundle protein
MNGLFLHERLEAYQALRRMARLVHQMVDRMPRGNAPLVDELVRAMRTSRLAIAEGANTLHPKCKLDYFNRAVHSNGESSACLDEIEDRRLAREDLLERAREELGTSTRCTLGLMNRLKRQIR